MSSKREILQRAHDASHIAHKLRLEIILFYLTMYVCVRTRIKKHVHIWAYLYTARVKLSRGKCIRARDRTYIIKCHYIRDVCINIYVYIHVCDYMSMEVFLCAFASLVVDTYLCMYVYVNMHVCRCKRAYIHTYICIQLRVLHFACFFMFYVALCRHGT